MKDASEWIRKYERFWHVRVGPLEAHLEEGEKRGRAIGKSTATDKVSTRAKRLNETPSTGGSKAADEARIRQLIEGWAKSLRAKDIHGVMSHYAPDILVFDLAPPLQYLGADVYRKNWEEWFTSWQGPIGCEIRNLTITVGDVVAFSHSLNRISGRRINGEDTDVWVRATAGFRKIDGKWLITHEHVSVPFYMDGSYRAAVDLKP
jgi:ketosteroid isomerase-like protein